MKKIILVFALCFSSALLAETAKRERLGVLRLNQTQDIRSCQSRGLKVGGVQIIMRRGNIDLDDLVVTFGNGREKRFSMNLFNIRPPFRSRELMFNKRRCIRSIRADGYNRNPNARMRLVVAAVDARSQDQRPPRPVPGPGPSDRFRVGMRVYNLDRSAFAEIIGRDRGRDTFVLRFLTGDLAGRTGGNWSKDSLAFTSGCAGRFCVGDRAYNVERSAYVQIEGHDLRGRYVLKYLTGSLAGKTGGKWTSDNLAELRGSSQGLRVGERAYNVERSAYVQIEGIQTNGLFVVKYLTGSLAGKTGGKWSRKNLAKLSGCSGRFCVGDRVYNNPRRENAEVVGIQTNGLFVLKFLTGSLAGKTGANWSESDLVRIRR